ncbi:MAG: hypothetical protein FWC73_03065 [Defluviitaleaceae bacterium]|nr:hypothetical protein [Defluviitaleaceae bacterium]
MDIQKRKTQYQTRRANRLPAQPTRYYLDAYLAHKDESPIVREAYALCAFWNNAPLEIYPEELILGRIHANEAVGFHYGGGTFVHDLPNHGIEPEELEAVRVRAYKGADPTIYTPEEMASINACASTSTWFGGHAVLDFERILKIGLAGYQIEIDRYAKMHADKQDFYKALCITLEGVSSFILRLADAASKIHGYNSDIPGNLGYIASNPPENFHQALQLVWILHYLDNSDSFGRFDSYLLTSYEKEKNRDWAKALLVDFWLRIEDAYQIQNMTIGGKYTDLTLLCLEVTHELGLQGPNLCLRITHDVPGNIMAAALNSIGTGIGLPALYNDEIYAESLTRSGIPRKIAEGYCFAGCSQVMIPGRSNFANDIGLMNVAKIFEMTLYDGYDPHTKQQAGPHTGAEFATFDEFHDAFMVQLEYACKLQVSIHNKELPYRASKEGYVLRSLFTRGCLEKGLSYLKGGAEFNNVQLELIGITNAADSLYAVKKAVFNEECVNFAQLVEALRSNWETPEGEELRGYLRSLPKFGNDYEDVDMIRRGITQFLYERLNREPGPYGGIYVPGEVIFVSHEYCGTVTGATPDGRGAGEVLADSAGASQGSSKEGPTALMNSMLKLPVADYLLTSTVLNMRFMPRLVNNPAARQGLSALIQSFFAQGGMQLQINVCDTETLKKAQANPEQYPDLIVRVGGYSDHFVRLSRTLQDEVISRAEY